MRNPIKLWAAIAMVAIAAAGCSSAPPESGLRDSFANQVAANKFIKDFQRNGDELTFSGPGAEGGTAKWRVHIDAAVVEPFKDDPAMPYKGTIKSTWFSNGKEVKSRGRESNLPVELLANGVANEECWAMWKKAESKWDW